MVAVIQSRIALLRMQYSTRRIYSKFASLRRFIYRHTVCVPQALLRWRSFVLGEKSLTCGRLVFRGPSSFLKLAEDAIRIIREVDGECADELCKLDVEILYFPGITTCFGNYFSIGSAYVNWGVDGLLAHILYIYFGSKSQGEDFFEYPVTEEDQITRACVYEKILAWLKERKLPIELAQDLAELKRIKRK